MLKQEDKAAPKSEPNSQSNTPSPAAETTHSWASAIMSFNPMAALEEFMKEHKENRFTVDAHGVGGVGTAIGDLLGGKNPLKVAETEIQQRTLKEALSVLKDPVKLAHLGQELITHQSITIDYIGLDKNVQNVLKKMGPQAMEEKGKEFGKNVILETIRSKAKALGVDISPAANNILEGLVDSYMKECVKLGFQPEDDRFSVTMGIDPLKAAKFGIRHVTEMSKFGMLVGRENAIKLLSIFGSSKE